MVKRAVAAVCCTVYMSEGKNSLVMNAIAASAAAAAVATEASFLHGFTCTPYDRVGFTTVGSLEAPHSGIPIRTMALNMVKTAIDQLDLQQMDAGSHPRLGVIDHVCFHPLGISTLQSVGSLARFLAREIGMCLGDFGPAAASPRTGVVIVGASPWVVNYNVPVLSTDLRLGRRIAEDVSSRGGGLRAVQAMAFLHGSQKIVIACNLTNCKLTSADRVQEEVSRLAERENICVEPGFITGHSEDEITEMAYEKLYGGG